MEELGDGDMERDGAPDGKIVGRMHGWRYRFLGNAVKRRHGGLQWPVSGERSISAELGELKPVTEKQFSVALFDCAIQKMR